MLFWVGLREQPQHFIEDCSVIHSLNALKLWPAWIPAVVYPAVDAGRE
jgi:hypothetical protein